VSAQLIRNEQQKATSHQQPANSCHLPATSRTTCNLHTSNLITFTPSRLHPAHLRAGNLPPPKQANVDERHSGYTYTIAPANPLALHPLTSLFSFRRPTCHLRTCNLSQSTTTKRYSTFVEFIFHNTSA